MTLYKSSNDVFGVFFQQQERIFIFVQLHIVLCNPSRDVFYNFFQSVTMLHTLLSVVKRVGSPMSCHMSISFTIMN